MSTKERREIVALAGAAQTGVLVTLVRAVGSSYRRPGARLLALPDGRTAGTISGGCLEADLLRRAQWRVRDGAVMQGYDTGFDDTAEVPFGLGCGGVVDLLLESSTAPEADALLTALDATLDGRARCVVTRLPGASTPMQRVVLDAGNDVLFCSESLDTDEVVLLRAMALGSATVAPDVFVEPMPPAQRLIVFGAGEDARPLTRVAAEMGWTVIVADGRPQQARPERFAAASAVMVTQTADVVLPGDAVVLMTHSFEQDRTLLEQLLTIRPRYLGLLGARQRSALLLRDAAGVAGLTLAEALERTHAPIGLELGGDGPECIALSIVAEVQAALQETVRLTPAGAARRMCLQDAEALLAQFGERRIDASHCALDSGAGNDDAEEEGMHVSAEERRGVPA